MTDKKLPRSRMKLSTLEVNKDLTYRREFITNIIDINKEKSGCIQYKYTTFELEEFLKINDGKLYT